MVEGRVKNSVRNIGYRLISQVASIVLKFVSRTIFIYILGVEYLGINGLFSEVLQMLSLADLGFGTAMVFSMYKPLAENDEKRLTQLVALYKRIYTIIAIVISVVGVALVPFLKYLVNLDQSIPYLKTYYLLYLANTVSSYLVVYKTCILNADQKNYLVSKYNTIFNFISLIITSAVLLLTHNFMVYLIAQVIVTYANNFYVSHVAERLYPYINNKVEKLPKEEGKKIFENVKSVFIYKVANTLVGSTDNTLISVLVGTITVGFYSNYSMVVNNIVLFINIVFSSVTASIGNMVVEANKKKNYEVYCLMQQVSFLLSTVAITCTYLIINDLIYVWLGKQFILKPLVIVAITLNMYFSVVLMPIWSYREATGMYMQTKYVMVATAIVNLVVSIILGKILGLAGILFATSIARISTYFWYEPKLLFKQFFEKDVWNYYIGILKNIIVTLVVVGASWLIFRNFVAKNWFILFAKAFLVLGCSMTLTIIGYYKDPYFSKLKALIYKVIKR
ncbi:lipopolysaccharide biosynthesis protein [uncultured Catenibacterium sp.]|uniref:lipopolysaccharide biosynthesis protein n=1 Tax=uncultured Catenibacterium sp. TaxID=286142 RepID=UPI0025D47A51|nr:oligosaccharide flippase family protein [uncultured Catenibacterium sp.]